MNRLARWFFVVAIISSCTLGLPLARANDVDAVNPSLPITPMNVRFQYVPLYLAQSISHNQRYGRIEALINRDLEQSWYEVILTDKTTGNKIFYLNSPAAVNILRNEGTIAHYASIEFGSTENIDSNLTYQIAFHDSDGQQIAWRFVVNPRVTEAETRIAPPLNAPGFVMMHASRRFAAGPGTAVTIGNEKKTVDAVAPAVTRNLVDYHAFSAKDLVIAEIVPGTTVWFTEFSPAQVREGDHWTFRGSGGQERTMTIERASGNQVQLRQVDRDDPFSPPAELEFRLENNGLVLRSISFSLQAHKLQISFQPMLPFPVRQLEDTADADFVVAEDGQSIAKGKVFVQRAVDTEHISWRFDSPASTRSNWFDSGVNVIW